MLGEAVTGDGGWREMLVLTEMLVEEQHLSQMGHEGRGKGKGSLLMA